MTLQDRPPQDGVSFQAVNYQDVDATARTLEAASIDTVICAFGMDNQAVQDTQLNLIQAADRSTCTRRFVVSGFDILYKEEYGSPPFSFYFSFSWNSTRTE